jgi:ligand-binding SRPBCC domain-containing protein
MPRGWRILARMRDFVREPIVETALIHAPIERVFALSTRVELVKKTLGMNLVESGLTEGVIAGHVQGGSRVHWRGWKFGLPTEHHTLITKFEAPHTYFLRVDHHEVTKQAYFQDSQEKGRFAFFQHDHYFEESVATDTGETVTALRDEVHFTLPFGVLGRVAAAALLAPHIRRLVQVRYGILRELAEGNGWQQWVDA